MPAAPRKGGARWGGSAGKGAAALLMGRGHEDIKTRTLAGSMGCRPAASPKRGRREPWECDKGLYKKRNEVERFFCRHKRLRRACTRYDKLGRMFAMFFLIGLIYGALL